VQDKNTIKDALKQLSFTHKDLAQFVGISNTAIRKIKSGVLKWGTETQAKIALFLRARIKKVLDILDDMEKKA